jgi:hypothetical protein
MRFNVCITLGGHRFYNDAINDIGTSETPPSDRNRNNSSVNYKRLLATAPAGLLLLHAVRGSVQR